MTDAKLISGPGVQSVLRGQMPSVLPEVQAASPRFPSAEFWKPRPGGGISSDWLIAELTHHQAQTRKKKSRFTWIFELLH